MNTKRWLLASVAVFVVIGALEFLIHGNGFGWYVILPIPLVLASYWFLATLVEFIVAGVAAGLVYRA